MSCRIALLCLLVSSGKVLAQVSAPQKPTVLRLHVADSFGAPLNKFGAIFENLSTQEKVNTAASELTLKPGRYRYRVLVRGFEDIASGEVALESGIHNLWIGLHRGPQLIVDPPPKPLGLSVRWSYEQPVSSVCLVRLVSIFTDRSATALVPQSGIVSFPEVKSGRYLLIALSRGQILGTKEITLPTAFTGMVEATLP